MVVVVYDSGMKDDAMWHVGLSGTGGFQEQGQ